MSGVAPLLAILLLATSLDGATIQGSGATFPAPLISKWAEEYGKTSNVTVEYSPIGSGRGVEQITKKLVDFGASDAP